MANPRTIAQILAEISTLYPLMFNPTPEQTAIWTMYLRDLDDELLLNALHHYVATARDNYPPSVPALRKACADLKRQAAGVPTAFEAWEELLAMGDGSPIRRCTGEYDSDGRMIIERRERNWSNVIVQTVARQMGWPNFPSHDDKEIDRAHFFKAYESVMAQMMDADRELPQVTKYIEAQRVTNGIKSLVDTLGQKRLEEG
jgi:hypothetical protein